MKTKITLISLLSILLLVSIFVSNENVAANFLARSSKPIKSFEEYSQMSNLKERITAINKETPQNKSALWRQNIIYQADRMNLSRQQKDWVKEAYDFFDAKFFIVAGGDEAEFIKTDLGKSYEKLMIRRSELFTKEQARKFCSVIGDDSTLINYRQESSFSNERVPTTCNCAASWFCTECPEDYECSSAVCFQTSGGCGCALVWNCTKMCTLGLP